MFQRKMIEGLGNGFLDFSVPGDGDFWHGESIIIGPGILPSGIPGFVNAAF
jgi:hypothetical protein